jgi:ABC-type multidrug transport system fused ATPase/permease subunit
MPTTDADDKPIAKAPFTKILRRFEREYLRPYRLSIALGLLGLLVQSLLLLPIPLLQGWVLDQLVAWGKAGSPRDGTASIVRTIVLATAGSIALYLAKSGLAWKIAAMMGRISQEVVVALRGGLHRKLMRLPMAYFDAQQTGRLMARVTSDVGGVLTFIRGGIIQLISDLILSAAISVLLVWLQWRLALVALVVVPLYALNQKLFRARLRRLSDQIRAQVATLYALLSERVSAVRVVRSFAKEEAELAALDEKIDRHRALSWQNTKTAAILGAVATLISGLGTVFVIWYGVFLVGRGIITVGELLAFYALVGQLYQPIVRLTQFQATALSTQISIERLYEVFDEPESVRDRPTARPIMAPKGSLEYRNVSFAYRPDGAKVLDGIDLAIEPGMTVGLLGASGAGKSTLLALAPRLYDLPDAEETGEDWGEVRFDGRDVRDWRLADLRRAVALVPQQALLFEGTIRSNLLYGNAQATAAQIRQALEIADFAATVDSFPHGLETPVGERGLSLSGGQRQRLALARAIVADPAALLLDDCTSALDSETEARIQAALRRFLPGRTCMIVSHKVASVRHADQIAVLEGGRIVELGDHDRLLDLDGYYAATYRRQTSALATMTKEDIGKFFG